MHYLYHRVPKDLQGDTLYPLNELMSKMSDVYAKEVSKYEGREHTTKQLIPLFKDCLWNDVLFFITVDPAELHKARLEAGWPDIGPQQYFKIDPQKLDQSKLGIFLFQPSIDPENLTIDNFATYKYEDLEKYAKVPQATKEYFKHEYELDAPYIKLFFRYVPHILYRGEVNIADAEIITVH